MDGSLSLDHAIELSQPKTVKASHPVKPYVYACVFSSLCIIVGVLWDISWHNSIGRDGLLAPPHDLIYLGAIISGLFSAYQVLHTTFVGTIGEKQASVKFWGVFYGPLGAMFCIWGAIAMLTSAPFDDWWHNTYGLDVVILSPPHTLLALGIMMIQLGAITAVLSSLHTEKKGSDRINKILFVAACGQLLTSFYTEFSGYLSRSYSHNATYYVIAAEIFPLFFITVKRAVNIRWSATATAAIYMFIVLLMVWFVPLFHATPRLGPVLNHFDHYQAFHFPLLLVAPAFTIDIVFWKLNDQKIFVKVIAASLTFLLLFFIIQWNFGAFLQTSPYARGWFFGSSSWYFGSDPGWKYRYAFNPDNIDTGLKLLEWLLIAAAVSVLSGLVGSKWGSWMQKVQR